MWDDWALIVRTVGFRGFDLRHLGWMFTTTHLANYTPLAWLSYAADYAFWGLNPVGYHLTNVVLHALAAVLFYRLAGLLLRRVFPGEKPEALELGAVVAALAFAVHPLRVESVAWASERRDVLSGAFFLATLLFYAQAAGSRDPRGRARRLGASVACFAAAALSKASVVPLPAALLVLDWYPLRRLGAGESPRARRAVLLEKLPYAAIASAAALMAVRAQIATKNFTAVADHDLAGRLIQALHGAGFYVAKTAVPVGLCALYPFERLRLFGAAALTSAAAIAAAVAASTAAGVPKKAQLALWGYYLAVISPVLGLLQNGPQLVALRYSYLPCLGWAALAGAGAVAALQDLRERSVRGAFVLGALFLWIVGNAWSVQRQVALWRDDEAVWGNVLIRYPLSAYANMNYGDALFHAGDRADAEIFSRNALRLAPDNKVALFTLARIKLEEHLTPESKELLERGLRADPDWGDARALLGVILSQEGRKEEALVQLQRAAALQPTVAETQENAGLVLAQLGRLTDALPYLERAEKLEPAYSVQLEHARADLARAASR